MLKRTGLPISLFLCLLITSPAITADVDYYIISGRELTLKHPQNYCVASPLANDEFTDLVASLNLPLLALYKSCPQDNKILFFASLLPEEELLKITLETYEFLKIIRTQNQQANIPEISNLNDLDLNNYLTQTSQLKSGQVWQAASFYIEGDPYIYVFFFLNLPKGLFFGVSSYISLNSTPIICTLLTPISQDLPVQELVAEQNQIMDTWLQDNQDIYPPRPEMEIRDQDWWSDKIFWLLVTLAGVIIIIFWFISYLKKRPHEKDQA